MQHIQLEAARVVCQVMHDGRNLNEILSESLRKLPNLNAQERGAFQDYCYGMLRYHSRLLFMLEKLLDRPLQDPLLQSLLMVGLYQVQHTRVEDHVIVDQAVRAAKMINARFGGLVNAILRNYLRQQAELNLAADQNEVSRYAYPKWWIDMVKGQYADHAPSILEEGNRHPPMTLRPNRQHTTTSEYQDLLASQDMPARIIQPDALILERPVAVDRLPGFTDGWISVQDAGAQYAARLLDVQDGMRVLDACAAPGGKSAHLLELANIELLSLDKNKQRLTKVRENLQRLKLSAQVVCGDANDTDAWWDGKQFQRILVDAPCSASGVVRRHPDIKWLRRVEDIEGFAKQQTHILDRLWSLLAIDGKLLYATCSIFARENQQVISSFLARHNNSVQIELHLPDMIDGQLLPNAEHDGFFYALLCKQG